MERIDIFVLEHGISNRLLDYAGRLDNKLNGTERPKMTDEELQQTKGEFMGVVKCIRIVKDYLNSTIVDCEDSQDSTEDTAELPPIPE